MSAPAAKRARSTKAETRRMLDAAVRAAGRASQRVLFTGIDLEHHVLSKQIAEIEADDAIETTDEYDLIILYVGQLVSVNLVSKTLLTSAGVTVRTLTLLGSNKSCQRGRK
jgi:hypothetical protein